jgi:hypothetical protein
LMVERPEHRRAVIRYLWQAVRRHPRSWRPVTGRPRPRLVSPWRGVAALASGPLRYLVSRFQHRHAAPVEQLRRNHSASIDSGPGFSDNR